jgi:hypothetical protein
VSPGKSAVATVWRNKRFWLMQALAWAVWTSLALSWFWLPDSKVWGIALSVVQGLAVILLGFWLIKKSLAFYRREHSRFDGKPPIARLLVDAVLLIAGGVLAPYALIGWHPVLPSFAMQTASLVVRFGAAFLIAVSAWLILASLLAIRSTGTPARSNSAPLSPQIAQPD